MDRWSSNVVQRKHSSLSDRALLWSARATPTSLAGYQTIMRIHIGWVNQQSSKREPSVDFSKDSHRRLHPCSWGRWQEPLGCRFYWKKEKRKEVTDLEVKLLSCWLLLRDSAGNPSGPGALLFVLEPCEVQRVLMKHLGRRLNLWIIVVVAD